MNQKLDQLRHAPFATIIIMLSLSVVSAEGAAIHSSNVNIEGSGANAFFESGGTIIPRGSGIIRLGTFLNFSDADIKDTFTVGNLSILDTNFNPFSDIIWSMGEGFDIDGIWDVFINESINTDDPLIGNNIYTWITTGLSFADETAEHFIYNSNIPFGEDPFLEDIIISEDSGGDIVVGEFGNFIHDFGFEEGPQPAFNTVPIPEPSMFLFLTVVGGMALIVALRHKNNRPIKF